MLGEQPEEIINEIVTHDLSRNDVLAFCATNIKFYIICKKDSFWKKLFFKKYPQLINRKKNASIYNKNIVAFRNSKIVAVHDLYKDRYSKTMYESILGFKMKDWSVEVYTDPFLQNLYLNDEITQYVDYRNLYINHIYTETLEADFISRIYQKLNFRALQHQNNKIETYILTNNYPDYLASSDVHSEEEAILSLFDYEDVEKRANMIVANEKEKGHELISIDFIIDNIADINEYIGWDYTDYYIQRLNY